MVDIASNFIPGAKGVVTAAKVGLAAYKGYKVYKYGKRALKAWRALNLKKLGSLPH